MKWQQPQLLISTHLVSYHQKLQQLWSQKLGKLLQPNLLRQQEQLQLQLLI
jgi:hypothetical protein